jgi:hypothetical protein
MEALLDVSENSNLAEGSRVNQKDAVKTEFDQFGFVKNYICASCGGKLQLDHEDDIGQKWFKCQKCGQQTCKPKSAERQQLEESLKKTETVPPPPPKNMSQADMLVKLARNHAKQVFHDERHVPYIRLYNSKTLRTLRLRSRDVKSWLAGLLWKTQEKAPNQEALSSALNVLEAQCQEGSAHKLYNRIAPGEDNSIWIDMADEKCRAIHITREGWQIVDNPPTLFRRYSHQKAIPEPVTGGNINQILRFANIKNEADKLLFVVTTVTYFMPDIPHAILILFGPQGSGKTWSLSVIRRLVDPSQLGLLNLPRRPRELVQNLDHHWCSFYDNVGRVSEWCSNVFCRAVTGMGVSKRALYTDDDDVIYSYHRCVGLTDINIAAERGDMLQRSLLLGLQAIPKKQRKTEKELNEIFEQVHPSILGAILDVMVKAIQIYPTIKLQGLHRMADYVVWSCAITEALGIDKQQFLDAYEENIVQQNLEMVQASPISDALIKLMEESPKGWEGTASQLFAELEDKAKELRISTRQKAWPKKPHILSRRLNELAPSLPAAGYQIDRGHKGKNRLILINSVGSVGSGENSVGTDATTGTFGSFSVHVTLEDLKAVHWADQFYSEHECCICGYQKLTCWQAETFKGNMHWICEDCKQEWEKQRNRLD